MGQVEYKPLTLPALIIDRGKVQPGLHKIRNAIAPDPRALGYERERAGLRMA